MKDNECPLCQLAVSFESGHRSLNDYFEGTEERTTFSSGTNGILSIEMGFTGGIQAVL